jgi:hypothetical protein
MVKVDGNDWYSPLFDYNDVQYGIDNGCSCWEPIVQPEGIHYCSCKFTCYPFENAWGWDGIGKGLGLLLELIYTL